MNVHRDERFVFDNQNTRRRNGGVRNAGAWESEKSGRDITLRSFIRLGKSKACSLNQSQPEMVDA